MNVLRPIQKEYYGDDYRWFFGTVVNSHPPAGLEGRVKVRIYGVHNPVTDEIPERDLPWAQVLLPTTEGGSSGIGRIPQLTSGAFVFGVFLDGCSSQIPLVLGSVPRIEFPTAIQSGRSISFEDKFEYNQERLQNVIITPLKDDREDDVGVGLRRQQCMKFFIDNGYEIIHAAAITGAIEGKSSFVTYDDDTTSATVGIVKWKNTTEVGSRFADLLNFAVKFSPSSDWRLFSLQLQFVLYELRTRFNLANSKLIVTTNIKDASAIINRDYIKGTNQTDRLAQRAYDEVFS
jgi:hypothetical protein